MAEHPNVQRMRDAYDAFAKGDLATLQEIWAPDLQWYVPGHTDMAGTYEGVPAVLGFLQQSLERSGGSLRAEPLSFFANDGFGVAVVRQTATRGDRTLDVQHAHINRFENGRVVEFSDTSSDLDADDAFWG